MVGGPAVRIRAAILEESSRPARPGRAGLASHILFPKQRRQSLLLDAPVLSACLPSGPAGVADFAVMLVGATGRFTKVFICCLLAVEPIGNISSLVSGYICMSV